MTELSTTREDLYAISLQIRNSKDLLDFMVAKNVMREEDGKTLHLMLDGENEDVNMALVIIEEFNKKL